PEPAEKFQIATVAHGGEADEDAGVHAIEPLNQPNQIVRVKHYLRGEKFHPPRVLLTNAFRLVDPAGNRDAAQRHGQAQGFYELCSFARVGAGITYLFRFAPDEYPIGDVPRPQGFAEPALRFRVVNGDAIDDHVNPQFAFDARAEDAGFDPLDELAGALTGAVLVVDFRNVDGIRAPAQLLEFVQRGFQRLGLRGGGGNHLEQRHRNGRM